MSNPPPEFESISRGPLKVRSAGLPRQLAARMAAAGIRPNTISIASIFCSVLAAAGFLMCGIYPSAASAAVLVAAFMIQFRSLCNLPDGLVAVEEGLGTRSGELFNDIPDRISAPLILMTAGYAFDSFPPADEPGWAAGLMALMTAYMRNVAASIGAPVDFSGPMAKQQRMATLTRACLVTPQEPFFAPSGSILIAALALVLTGRVATTCRRAAAACRFPEASPDA